jgi:uncharacterized protein (DUF305 family)
MKTRLRLTTFALLALMPGAAFAQTDQHHQDTGAPQAPATVPTQDSTADGLPEQCTAMMSMMQEMMPTMQEMMPGVMVGDMPMSADMSDAGKAYMQAMKRMDGPMMQALQADDPDVAFVQAMIPHHQGAIDMAKAVLQFGKDDQVKVWANQIIATQEAEIAAMQEWLEQRAK